VTGRLEAPVIAIDGPSGAGKSTVAQEVARELGFRYLDTGAMYRALTWLALHDRVDLTHDDELIALAESMELGLTTDAAPVRITVRGHDVTDEIRGPDVTSAVSKVSAVPGVREAMVRRQREIIGAGGIVVEGRDIGSTVAPDAPVKVFLTADEAARAQRRASEASMTPSTAQATMATRDALDSSRNASPLRQALGAVVIDSTHLSAAEVVQRVVSLARDPKRATADK
jgi:cytidylate kinase